MICNNLNKKKKASKVEGIEFEYLSEDSDEDRSDEEVDDLQRLEAFIKASKSLVALRNNLRTFIHRPLNAPGEEKDRGVEKPIIEGIDANESSSGAEIGKTAELDRHASILDGDGLTKASGPTMDENEVRRLQRLYSVFRINDASNEEIADYNLDGYGYAKPKDLVEYDLRLAKSQGSDGPSTLDNGNVPYRGRRSKFLGLLDADPMGSNDDSKLGLSWTKSATMLSPTDDFAHTFEEMYHRRAEMDLDSSKASADQLLDIATEKLAAPVTRPRNILRALKVPHDVIGMVKAAFRRKEPPLEGWTRIEYKCVRKISKMYEQYEL